VSRDATPSMPPAPQGASVHDLLSRGAMTIKGRFTASSNATFLVTCELDGRELMAVYKPMRGERPLWDFPPGIYRREVAAYLLSEALGWKIVPETLERHDAPLGPGSVQRFVPEDGDSHYFTLCADQRWHSTLVTIAAFDVIANNADRKSGHVLLAEDRLWAIDNGLCFHHEPKLRTVIWDFAGEPLGEALANDLTTLLERGLAADLEALLEAPEREALLRRTEQLLENGRLPKPTSSSWRPYPWPLV